MISAKRISLFAFVGFFIISLSLSGVSGTYGETGSIEVAQTASFDSGTVTVKLVDLVIDSMYKVNATGDATGFSFQTSGVQTSFIVHMTFDKPADSETVYIWLYGSIYGNTTLSVLDTATFQVKDDSILPLDFILTLGISVFILLIIVKFAKGMRT